MIIKSFHVSISVLDLFIFLIKFQNQTCNSKERSSEESGGTIQVCLHPDTNFS